MRTPMRAKYEPEHMIRIGLGEGGGKGEEGRWSRRRIRRRRIRRSRGAEKQRN